jgi:hypothetical protein
MVELTTANERAIAGTWADLVRIHIHPATAAEHQPYLSDTFVSWRDL